MNEVIQNNMTELLGIVNDMLQSGVVLMRGDAPVLVNEILGYHTAMIWLGFVTSALLLVGGLVSRRIGYMRRLECWWDDDLVMLGTGMWVAGAIILVVSTRLCIKMHTAPLLYTVDVLKQYIKGAA